MNQAQGLVVEEGSRRSCIRTVLAFDALSGPESSVVLQSVNPHNSCFAPTPRGNHAQLSRLR